MSVRSFYELAHNTIPHLIETPWDDLPLDDAKRWTHFAQKCGVSVTQEEIDYAWPAKSADPTLAEIADKLVEFADALRALA